MGEACLSVVCELENRKEHSPNHEGRRWMEYHQRHMAAVAAVAYHRA